MDNKPGLLGEVIADIVGAIPGTASLARRGVANFQAEWERNTSRALKAAERITGMSREDIEDQVESDPRLMPLYLKVIWAAGMNGHDEVLQAMGIALGVALDAARSDDTKLEDAELALRAMGELTPRHFVVLRVLADQSRATHPSGSRDLGASTAESVAKDSGFSDDVTHQCLINLAGAGLAQSRSVYGGTAYPITNLGLAVVKAAKELRADPP